MEDKVILQPDLEHRTNSVEITRINSDGPTVKEKTIDYSDLRKIYDKLKFEPVDVSSINFEYRGTIEYTTLGVYTNGIRAMVLIPMDKVKHSDNSYIGLRESYDRFIKIEIINTGSN